MSDADKLPGLPDLSEIMLVSEQIEVAKATDPALKDAEMGELLRLVPGKRAILEGRFEGQAAVFRICLDPTLDVAAREWAEINRLWPLMQARQYRIARPLHYSRVNRIVVLEHVPGTPLLDHIKAHSPGDRSKFWPPVAKWLHHATESTETWQPEQHIGWLTRAQRAASAQPVPKLRVVELAILTEMERIGRHFSDSDWRVAICHGDYHPNNLIARGDCLTAVDTGGSARLPIYKDMARFLVHLARRGIALSDEQLFGVDGLGFKTFVQVFDLSHREERLILPFMIGCEALLRVENKKLSESRIDQALDMSEALLGDLRQVSHL